MSALAAVTLGAALLVAPAPPARPVLTPGPPAHGEAAPPAAAEEIERLLLEVRRIRERRQETQAPAPAAAPAAPPPPGAAAPARVPLPPARPLTGGVAALEPRRSATAAAPGAAADITGPAASPAPRRRPVWVPSGPETAGNRARRPARADEPGSVEAGAEGRDATPGREAPRLVRRPPASVTDRERQVAKPQKIPVCRDPRIDGTMIQQIAHPSWPCGIAQPVRINAIAGIRLSTPATLDCHTASRLATWVTGVLAPAARQQLGSGVDKLWIMGTYACRRRNNKPNGKLSEHARGRAIDVGGFWLADGRKVTLAGNWGQGAAGRVLADARTKACGLFHTVLGPGSDRYHSDHLHLDTSPRGGDPYCR